ncbi:hypothetical protein GW940_00455 [Candidatus Microgenomates bacterium]|nr:hypothetical protein [Candidatus Microgenomates bacterium]
MYEPMAAHPAAINGAIAHALCTSPPPILFTVPLMRIFAPDAKFIPLFLPST